jgi:NADH:ubiquinone oxidoreductase subunit B-like Fe-S oxidoreductase
VEQLNPFGRCSVLHFNNRASPFDSLVLSGRYPRHSDVMIVAGTLTNKMAPALRRCAGFTG